MTENHRPIIDPTTNVIALVEANAKAAAALREADIKFSDATATHIREINMLRAVHAETLRTSDLDRLDKTRQVDVLAASASAAALATAVQTLASTADRNADALRNLVNATAATMAKQTSDQAATLSAATDSLVKDINARIAELQKSSYTGAGKQQVADPQMAQLIVSVDKLLSAGSVISGKSEGISASWLVLLGAVSLISTLIAIGSFVFTETKAPASVAPQVIYVPAPAVGNSSPLPGVVK